MVQLISRTDGMQGIRQLFLTGASVVVPNHVLMLIGADCEAQRLATKACVSDCGGRGKELCLELSVVSGRGGASTGHVESHLDKYMALFSSNSVFMGGIGRDAQFGRTANTFL